MKNKFLKLLDDGVSGKDGTAETETKPAIPAISSGTDTLKPELPASDFPVSLLAVSRTGPKSTDVRVQIRNRYNGGTMFAKMGDPITFRRIDKPETWVLVRIYGNELLMESDTHRVKIYKDNYLTPLVPPWLSPEQIAAIKAARTAAANQAAASAAAQPQQQVPVQRGPTSSLPTYRAPTGVQRPVKTRSIGGSTTQGQGAGQKQQIFKNRRFGSGIGGKKTP